MNPSDSLRSAYDAIKNKNIPLARQILRQIIESDSMNATAWHLYAHVAETRQEAVFCLRKTLELNGANEQARQELAKLQSDDLQPGAKQTPPQNKLSMNRLQADQTSANRAKAKKSSAQNQNLIWILAGTAGIVLICCLGGLFLMSSQLSLVPQFTGQSTPSAYSLPLATITPLAQLSNPSTQVAGCSCDEAIPYLDRTAARLQQLIGAVNQIEQAIQSGTVTQLDFAAFNGQAKTFYHDQVAEVPPTCLQPFQTKTVALFWNWQQSMEYVANGQYNSAQIFIEQFQEQISVLEDEGKKILTLLQSCPGNQSRPNSIF
ncbi:MAG: hypothetical protein M1282_03120 [Chloroflexi bacterium]|nr:hypothetical protein [Chloroflexota bacterium]